MITIKPLKKAMAVETRRYWITGAIEWFKKEHDWPGLQTIACVENVREIKDKATCEQRYYITSLPGQAVPFAEAVRRHWAIENCLHWSLM